jgi:hypothetical protein
MKAFEDIQLAISNLPGADQSRLIEWIMKRAESCTWAVREATSTFGISFEAAATVTDK